MKKADFCLGLLLVGAHIFCGCASERPTTVTNQEFRIGEIEISETDVPSIVESGVLLKARESSSNQLKSPILGQLKENRISLKESAEEIISVPLTESATDSFDRMVHDLNQSSKGSDDARNDKFKKFPDPVIELVEGANHGSQPVQHKGVKDKEIISPGPDKSLSQWVKEENQSPKANASKQNIALSTERENMQVSKKTESEELIQYSAPKPLSSSINKKSEESPTLRIAYNKREEKGSVNSEKEKSLVHLHAEGYSFPETAIDAKSLELGNHSDHSTQIAIPRNEQQILLEDPLSAEIYAGDNKVMQRVTINDSKNLRLNKDEVLLHTSKKLSDGVKNNFEKLQHFLSGKNRSGNPKKNEQTRNYQKLKGWVPDGDDLNNSQILEESNPKQFRHALDWIERKGRTQVE